MRDRPSWAAFSDSDVSESEDQLPPDPFTQVSQAEAHTAFMEITGSQGTSRMIELLLCLQHQVIPVNLIAFLAIQHPQFYQLLKQPDMLPSYPTFCMVLEACAHMFPQGVEIVEIGGHRIHMCPNSPSRLTSVPWPVATQHGRPVLFFIRKHLACSICTTPRLLRMKQRTTSSSSHESPTGNPVIAILRGLSQVRSQLVQLHAEIKSIKSNRRNLPQQSREQSS